MGDFWQQALLVALGAGASLGGVALQARTSRRSLRAQLGEQRRDRRFTEALASIGEFLIEVERGTNGARAQKRRADLEAAGWNQIDLDRVLPHTHDILSFAEGVQPSLAKLELLLPAPTVALAREVYDAILDLYAHEGGSGGKVRDALSEFKGAARVDLHGDEFS